MMMEGLANDIYNEGTGWWYPMREIRKCENAELNLL
jgi:hypothetical protein